MNDGVVYLIASVFAAIALLASGAFIWRYWRHANWRRTLIGRVIMHRAMTMFLILAYVFSARWFEIPEIVQAAIGLAVWAGVAVVEVRMYLVIWYITAGKVTLDQPNYTPVRNVLSRWWEKGRNGADA